MYLFNFIATFSVLFPFIAGNMIKKSYKNNSLNFIITQFATVYVDAYIWAEIFAWKFHNNIPIYTLLNLVELVLFSLFVTKLLQSKRANFIIFLTITILFGECIFRKNVWEFYSFFFNVKCLAIIGTSFSVIYYLIKNQSINKKILLTLFFILSILFYNLCTFYLYLFLDHLLLKQNKSIIELLISITLTVEILRNASWLLILKKYGN